MAGFSRRSLLRGALAAGAGAATAPLLGGCVGFATSGTSGLTFLSTQFTPVEEAERFRALLRRSFDAEVGYVTSDPGQFTSQVRSQVEAGNVRVALLGGLHGDLAPLAPDCLTDLTDLVADFSALGWPPEYLELAKAGTDRTWYVPWAQASYLLAAHVDALAHLPSGADPEDLSYEQFLDWAVNARRANGNRPMLGLPGGPKGLLHRFLQGYLLPSFTGGQITTFNSPEAVTAWEYLRELWRNCAPASTNYDFMQDPLEAGEVRFAWDHVARLVNVPKREPDRWRMLPAPRGPKGRGYMAVLTGLAIPRGAPHQDQARRLIATLSKAQNQLELLRANAFFPTVRTPIPADLPPAIRLEAAAVAKQRQLPGALLSLPPVGLGSREGELGKAFRDCFQSIVLGGADIRSTVDRQTGVLAKVLAEARVPCWAPDPRGDGVCEVG
ncbi:ABC transporter substrate-binding protein [Crossiella sp. SN42]|uniref:ABC transporter substrate-binding protein n=1 Tax=Crossiella sp. SN42 TaxID=2944808 RepID=UPI00207C20F3|nr:extracellular solute-binding protein [Crossiella sp. SN42]MCO1574392.1 ABC transporter substrate-binding protein [Crossiella sp. SN42]